MKSFEKSVYTNSRNDSIEFGFYTNFVVSNFENTLENDVVTNKNVGQDGTSFVNSSLGTRSIIINGVFKHTDHLERTLKKVLNPKLTGVLKYIKEHEERYVNVTVDSVPDIKTSYGMSTFNIELTAQFPFWEDKKKTEYLAVITPKLRFTLIIPQKKGIVFGTRRDVLQTLVKNIGDVDCGFKVVFKARGSIVNPQITNKETGEQIRILYDMERGDVLEVINEPNLKMVLLNGKRALHHLDRLSTKFFALPVGDTMLAYSADLNISNLDVILSYSPLYL